MATTEPTSRAWVRPVLYAGAVAGLAAVIALLLRTPPQMGADEDAFRTVDALYTAVRMHDPAKLADCEQRLHAHRAAGKLPADAADHLDRMIAKARGGDWDTATERLYTFMLAQRREGDAEPKAKPQKTTRPTRR